MLNIRYDYGFVGKLFGVPRKILSQLCGFCSSITIEGRILKATFPAFPVPDKNPVKFWLDEEELAAFIAEHGGETEDLTHDDITDWYEATDGFLDGDDYDDIIGSVEGIIEIVDGILEDYLSSADIGVTVAEEDHTHTTADITDWGTATANFLTDADMSAYALDADLAALEDDVADIADLVDAIDQDLADLCDYVESMDGDIEDLVSWYDTGISGSFTFLTDVQFNGTALQKRTQTVTITNGIVTKIGTASGWTNWHTPTVITWA